MNDVPTEEAAASDSDTDIFVPAAASSTLPASVAPNSSFGMLALERGMKPLDVFCVARAHIKQRHPGLLLRSLEGVKLNRILGSGDFGSVYECDGSAVKRISFHTLITGGGYDQERAQLLVNEIAAMLELPHPNLLALEAVSFADSSTTVCAPDWRGPFPPDFCEIWIWMPVVPGGSLREKLCEIRQDGNLCVQLLRQVAGAVASMHNQGWGHFDIKPDNVLLDYTTHPPTAKLIDFGFAQRVRRRSGCALPLGQHCFWTTNYEPPELNAGPTEVNPSADVYAFGVTALELLTTISANEIWNAVRTNKIDTVLARLPTEAQSLRALLEQCVSGDPTARPTMSGVYQALCAAPSGPVATAAAAVR
jgi:serine/threonine protein kinase